MSASRTLSAGLRVPLGRFDLQAQGAAAGGVGHEIELHRQHFAVAAEGDLLRGDHLAGARRFRAGSVAGRPRQHLHRNRFAGHPLGLEVAGHRVMVAGIRPGRRRQIADGDFDRLPVRSEPDGVDGDFRFLGERDGRLGRNAGVLPAVAEDDDARNRRAAFLLDQLPQGLAKPRFDARGGEQFRPIGRRRSAGVFRLSSPPDCDRGRLLRVVRRFLGQCRHVVAFQIFAERKDDNVVRLAQLGEKIGLLQRLGKLLRPADARRTTPSPRPSAVSMLKLVSANTSTREFRTSSRSVRQCGWRYRMSSPKKAAALSAVNSQPQKGLSSTESRRYM